MLNYSIVLFDADETLFDFKRSERYAFEQTLIQYHLDQNLEHHLKIYQEINDGIWKEFEEGKITQKTLKVERFRRLARALHADFDEEEFARSYMGHLGEASFLLEGSQELVKSLYGQYRLGIITNGLTEVQTRRIRQSIIGKYFEEIVISEEIGVAKPDARIFQYTLERFGQTDKAQVLMVGDNLSSDIRGGRDFGIDTCWFNPSGLPNATSIHPNYEIRSLEELQTLLNR